jgi:CxxC-x17-CxxC domain-containing protein
MPPRTPSDKRERRPASSRPGPRGASGEGPSRSGRSARVGPTTQSASTHGTLVHFEITCGRCGAEDVLPFVPKGGKERLCRNCAEATFGPDWHRGRAVEKAEPRVLTCGSCGCTFSLYRAPAEGEVPVCQDCFAGLEKADPTRLKGLESVDRAAGVRRIRGPGSTRP